MIGGLIEIDSTRTVPEIVHDYEKNPLTPAAKLLTRLLDLYMQSSNLIRVSPQKVNGFLLFKKDFINQIMYLQIYFHTHVQLHLPLI